MIQSQLVTRMFRKPTPVLIAAIMAIGLLACASRGLAANLTWTNGNDVWTSPTAWTTNQATGLDPVTATNITCGVGAVSNVTATCVGGNGVPSTGDLAFFTNNANPKVSFTSSPTLSTLVFSNALATMGSSASTLTVTGALRIAQSENTTATVYWAGGTLAVTNTAHASVVQIGSGSNSVGALFVTNGTLVCDHNFPGSSVFRGILLGTASAGKLVISGPGVVTNAIGATPTLTLNGGSGVGAGSQLVITNGGRLFLAGATMVLSNGLVLVSDPGSYMTNADGSGPGTGAIIIGGALGPGRSALIVSNGASVWAAGTITIGRTGSSFNTGVVVGAGSKLISGPAGFFQVGSSTGATNNDLVVYDGGYLNCGGGTFTISDSALCRDNSLHMGGVGAMSTGVVVFVRNNSGSQNNTIVVTNAVFAASQISSLGLGANLLSVLSKGTVILSNQYAVSATLTNVLTVSAPTSTVSINAGTISVVSGSNALGVVIGNGSLSFGNTLIITNGGKLLSELGTIGASSSFNTGVVAGVGSVWSNFTAGAGYVTSNSLSIGGGTTANGTRNFLVVRDGARLVNNGSLDIGDSASSTFNSAFFGGPGAPAVIVNSGFVDVGGASGTSGNSLTISNASLTCDTLNVGGAGTNRINNTLTFNGGTIAANFVKVRESNTFVFAAGTLSAGSMDTDPGANSSNEFIVGDGTSAAYYDMVAGDTGYHVFGSPGLVVTNGASLRGSGTLTGTLTVLGTFVPGFANAVGSVFSSNSLTFGSSAVLNYDLGTNSDSVTVNGNLALGSSTLNVSDSGGFGAGTYVLFTHTNTVTAPPGTLTVGTLPAGFTAVVSNDVPNAQVLLVVSSTGGGNPYSTWLTHYGLAGGNALGTADPDADGMNNTNEFLAGFNPTSNAAYLHVISILKSGSDMNITYLGANGDTTYSGGPAIRTNVLEFTTGTVNGSYSTNGFASTGQTNILSGGTGAGLVTNMVDSGGATNKPSRYYRVRVLLP